MILTFAFTLAFTSHPFVWQCDVDKSGGISINELKHGLILEGMQHVWEKYQEVFPEVLPYTLLCSTRPGMSVVHLLGEAARKPQRNHCVPTNASE